MILIRICWYLCVMFLVVVGFSSFMTTVPEVQKAFMILRLVALALAISAASAALILKRQFRNKPDSFIFRSKVVAGICIAVAVILTLFFVGGILG